uniref:Uncharacterized protein n=1 Tax=Fervidobacterium pennivorans TaxID=93466 RepID=A0A7V4KEH9_FERPE
MFLERMNNEEKRIEVDWEFLLVDYLMFIVFVLFLAVVIVFLVKSITTLLIKTEVIGWLTVRPAG